MTRSPENKTRCRALKILSKDGTIDKDHHHSPNGQGDITHAGAAALCPFGANCSHRLGLQNLFLTFRRESLV